MSTVHWSDKYHVALLLLLATIVACVMVFPQVAPEKPQTTERTIRIPFSEQLAGISLQPAAPSYQQTIRLDMEPFVAEFKAAPTAMYVRPEYQSKKWCRMISATFSFIGKDGIARTTTQHIRAPALADYEKFGACASNAQGFYFNVLPDLQTYWVNQIVIGVGLVIVGAMAWLTICLVFVWGPRWRWEQEQKT